MNNFDKIIGVDYEVKETDEYCEKHNVQAKVIRYTTGQHTSVISRCPYCRQEKKELMAQQQAEDRKKQLALQKQQEIERITKNSKIHVSYAHATFETFESRRQPEIYPLYYKYAYNIHNNIRYGKNIFARGATGRGKTHLAVAVAKVAMSNCYTVLFETLKAIELSLENKDKKLSETIKVYNEVDLLIIDELIKITYPKTKQIVDEILEYRYNHRKPTIINTHLPMTTIAEIFDETRRSRLKENCIQKPYVDFDQFYAEDDAKQVQKYDYRNINNKEE